MQDHEEPLSLVLFSGTDDKLNAAAILAVGAAAMGRPVNVFLQYYALRAFRAGTLRADHALASEATEALSPVIRAHGTPHWSELLRQAKDVGEVNIQACALSMDMFRLKHDDLDPLVDGVEGVTAFYLNAGQGHMVFI